MIAVNIYDLSTIKADVGLPFELLIAQAASTSSPTARTEPDRIDGDAVVLDRIEFDEWNAERIEAWLSVLDGMAKRSTLGHRLRIFEQGPRGGWKKRAVA